MQRCPTCEQEFADEMEECPVCAGDDGEVFRCARCEENFRGSEACPACGLLRAEAPCELHPDRMAQGRCVACGRVLCNECAAVGRPAFLCEDHRSIMVIEGWTQVYSTHSEFEAQLVRENLRAEGMDAQIFSQRDRIFSVDLGELSIVRILVPAIDYARALGTIREHMDTDGEVVFACPACGEAFDPGASECTACGASLV
jgi:hypothetical protein